MPYKATQHNKAASNVWPTEQSQQKRKTSKQRVIHDITTKYNLHFSVQIIQAKHGQAEHIQYIETMMWREIKIGSRLEWNEHEARMDEMHFRRWIRSFFFFTLLKASNHTTATSFFFRILTSINLPAFFVVLYCLRKTMI
jgi:hypothetical protein